MAKPLRLTCSAARPLSAAPLSETQIEQLFQNLMSNALRHAAEVEHPKLFIAENQARRCGHLQ